MITRDNYEIYFIDFFEDNLSEDEITMLNDFLAQHDDLKKEFDEFQNVSLNEFNKDEVQEDFSFLKKTNPINELNELDYFIGKIEGDLSIQEEKDLNSYLDDNPEKKKGLILFEKTKLVAPNVVFTDKRSLKKRKVIPLYYYLSGVAAASIVLIFSFQFLFETNSIISYLPRESKMIFVETEINDSISKQIKIIEPKLSKAYSPIKKKRGLIKMEAIKGSVLPQNHFKTKSLAINSTSQVPELKVLPEDTIQLEKTTPIKNKEVLTIGQFATKKISGVFLSEEKVEITPNDLLASVGVSVKTTTKPINYDIVEPVTSNEKVVFKLGKLKVIRRKK